MTSRYLDAVLTLDCSELLGTNELLGTETVDGQRQQMDLWGKLLQTKLQGKEPLDCVQEYFAPAADHRVARLVKHNCT